MDLGIRTPPDNQTPFAAPSTTQTFGDDVADVSPTQTGPADCRPGDVTPVDHLVHTVVGHSNYHTVLARVEEDSKSFCPSVESLKEPFL